MSKATRNYTLFIAMSLLALFEIVSGFVLWLVLPRGGGGFMGGRGVAAQATFLWVRDTWLDAHNWVGVALLVIVVTHVVLHWKWIVRMTKGLGRPE
jgi:hypothetical protein